MLTDEERKLPDRNPTKHRYDELAAFCQRYHDIDCPLTDAEKELIEKTAMDIGTDIHIAKHIIAVVTADTCKVTEYCRNNEIGTDYNYFQTKIRRFFSVLDFRKRKLEARGKYIIDSFEGSVHDMSRSMQEHVDNGWNIIDVSTFCKDNAPYSVAYFQKLEPEERAI